VNVEWRTKKVYIVPYTVIFLTSLLIQSKALTRTTRFTELTLVTFAYVHNKVQVEIVTSASASFRTRACVGGTRLAWCTRLPFSLFHAEKGSRTFPVQKERNIR